MRRAGRLGRYPGAREIFGEGVHASPGLDGCVEGRHFLLHESGTDLAQIGTEAVAECLALGLTVV
jgi:hypothetical protein